MGYKDKSEQRAFQLNWITVRHQKYLNQVGCCFFCGSHDDIEIHHIDPDEKDSHKIWSWTEDKIELELRKCVAMCHTCHKRFHQLMKRKAIRHGTQTGYKLGCRCNHCRAAHAEYAKKYRQRKSAVSSA